MNLTLFKAKQIAAQKGYDLLKSKADALKVNLDERTSDRPEPPIRDTANPGIGCYLFVLC
jgi:hypothetical protein